MQANPKVLVYGASGYTGKLVAESLAKRDIPFYATGRSAERLQQEMAIVKDRFGGDFAHEIVAVDNSLESLKVLFDKVDVVINTVGPFMQLGWPVIEAACQSGCHYLDTTGEQDWSLAIKEKFGADFAAKGLLMAPATAWMCAAGALAAEVCLEDPNVDSLDIVYMTENGLPSEASTKSFLRIVCNNQAQYYLDQNEYKNWKNDMIYHVTVPLSNRIHNAHPWGGFLEPLWYKDDERVRTCKCLMAIGDEIVTTAVGVVQKFNEEVGHLGFEEREAFTNAMAEQIDSGEPPKDHPDVQRSMISCNARGRGGARSFVLHLAAPYTWTGEICAESAARLLAGKLIRPGFQSVARAFDHRELLKVWHAQGLCSYPED